MPVTSVITVMNGTSSLAGPDASASGLDGVQPSFLMGWVLRSCSSTAPSLWLLILSAVVFLWVRLPQCASAARGLWPSLQALPLGVGLAFSL
jgi:hypothetical protein